MKNSISVIEFLAHGIDPISGEVLPYHSPYHHPEVLRALFLAIATMKESQALHAISTEHEQ